MFPDSLLGEFKNKGDDLSNLYKNFSTCSSEMMLMRRYLWKDMLTQEVYSREEDDSISIFRVPCANQMFKDCTGGYFSVHKDNKHLVPLFQLFYLMIDSNILALNTNISEDSPVPIVNVVRSSGKKQEVWLNRTIALRFFNKISSSVFTPYINVQWLEMPKQTIVSLCKRGIRTILRDNNKDESFELHDIPFDINDFQHEIVEMVNDRVRLTKEFVGHICIIDPSEEFQRDIKLEIEFIEMTLNEKLMCKYVPINEFVENNPDFNLQMEVRHIEYEMDGDETVRKMSETLNQFIDYQMELVRKHTAGTVMSKFFDLITIV